METHKVILNEWQEVYSVQPVTMTLWTENMQEFKNNTTYYQTFGGGPEGGYFVKTDKNDLQKDVWEVTRNWYQEWQVKKIDNAAAEYEPENQMDGMVARIRILTVKLS